MNKSILVTAALFGLLAVVLGAFAAHGLQKLVTPEQIDTFQTGVTYQMYHAFLLLFLGVTTKVSVKTKRAVYVLILIGVFFFSGSIYGLATNSLTAFNFKTIALITPVGGTLLISAWFVLLINFLKQK
ncbi:DUF423 domain-containing protein [Mangrovimonas cancribranchiae]|uniref:DUF423 domain-containing protein n=1 Tax=Mangrovimonas cancribranchiae TaxID=3080055 RepID=A0AAU6P2P7_9FLAO